MFALMSALLVLSTAAGLLWRLHRRGGFRFRLEQFRPAAPLAGLLPSDREAQRQYCDLRAVYDLSESHSA